MRTQPLLTKPKFAAISGFCMIVMMVACTDIDKIKQEAYQNGLDAGKRIKYDSLVMMMNELPSTDKYVGSAKNVPIDTKRITQQLSKPGKDNFDAVVLDVNSNLLRSSARRIGLNEEEETGLVEHYKMLHSNYADDYYAQYSLLCAQTGRSEDPNGIIKLQAYNRNEALAKVISNQFCTILGKSFTLMRIDLGDEKAPKALGIPTCADAGAWVLSPFMDDLIESGFVYDFEEQETSIEKKSSKMVMELAAQEETYKEIIKEKKTEATLWGLIKSSAEIEAEYNGIVKAGFDFNERLEIEIQERTHTILIRLGKPKIFDPVIYPTIEKMEDGIFAKVEKETINHMHLTATNNIIAKAEKDHILEKAEKNAQEFLETLFSPIASLPPIPYRVKVETASNPQEGRIPNGI